MHAAIISAADAAYFDLLLGLIQSIRRLPESRTIDVCILDVGMTPEQLAALAPLVKRIAPAQWDIDFPDRPNCPPAMRAQICRPHLPRYFPEFDLLIWIDADAWVCNWDAVGLLLQAASTFGFAIIPELDRAYLHCYQLRRGVLDHLHGTYLEAFGPEAAQRYALLPLINSGVFAMRAQALHWQVWSDILRQALQRSSLFLVEQCALNVAIYTGRIQPHFLPSWCNWNCAHALPLLNPATRELHAPLLPHERISICHLNDRKRDVIDITCTDGTTRQMPLTFQAVHDAPPAGSPRSTKT